MLGFIFVAVFYVSRNLLCLYHDLLKDSMFGPNFRRHSVFFQILCFGVLFGWVIRPWDVPKAVQVIWNLLKSLKPASRQQKQED